MALSTPTANVNAILAGALAQVCITPWVSNYGFSESNLVDLGALRDIKVTHEIKATPIEADNILCTLGSAFSQESFKLSGKMLQLDLKLMSRLTGTDSDGSNAVVVAWVDDTTDGTITWGRGSVNTQSYFTATLHLEGLSLQYPYGGNSGNDVYTQATLIIPRCRPVVKTDQAYKKGTAWEYDFELEAFYDSSVTTAGHELFKMILKKPK